jgi:hypothetical protein
VLLVVVALLSPGRAEARCGHSHTFFKTNLLVTEPSAQPAPEAPTEAPSTPAKPCDGPNCSEHPTPNAPAPTVASSSVRAAEAVLNLGTEPPADARGSFSRDDSSAEPINHTAAIFHPPRA